MWRLWSLVGVIVGRTNSETITKKAGSVAAKRRRGKLEEWVPFLTILTTTIVLSIQSSRPLCRPEGCALFSPRPAPHPPRVAHTHDGAHPPHTDTTSPTWRDPIHLAAPNGHREEASSAEQAEAGSDWRRRSGSTRSTRARQDQEKELKEATGEQAQGVEATAERIHKKEASGNTEAGRC